MVRLVVMVWKVVEVNDNGDEGEGRLAGDKQTAEGASENPNERRRPPILCACAEKRVSENFCVVYSELWVWRVTGEKKR